MALRLWARVTCSGTNDAKHLKAALLRAMSVANIHHQQAHTPPSPAPYVPSSDTHPLALQCTSVTSVTCYTHSPAKSSVPATEKMNMKTTSRPPMLMSIWPASKKQATTTRRAGNLQGWESGPTARVLLGVFRWTTIIWRGI